MNENDIEDAQQIRIYIIEHLIPWAYEKGIKPSTIACALHAIGKMVTMKKNDLINLENGET